MDQRGLLRYVTLGSRTLGPYRLGPRTLGSRSPSSFTPDVDPQYPAHHPHHSDHLPTSHINVLGTPASALWTGAATAFKRQDLVEACTLYNRLWTEHERARPYCWARGIALFYVGDFEGAAAQFKVGSPSPVTRHPSPVARRPSPVARRPSPVACRPSSFVVRRRRRL